uniref:Mitochondrial carrier protein n=1 Tax=Caenorhabditis japonica TaxID=281687 RepID=A0A8R1DYM8_CAEJA
MPTICENAGSPNCSKTVCEKQVECCKKQLTTGVIQQISASSSGAIVTSLFMTPLDVVKIRLQQQHRPFPKGECFYYHNGLMEVVCEACEVRKPCEWYQRPGNFKGTADAFVKIARHEGIRSLWSGLAPTMVMALPATVFYFTIYDNLSASLKKKMCCRRAFAPDKWTPPDWTAAAVAGIAARSIAVTVVSPIEMVRTKMQSQKLTYHEVGHLIRSSFATKGISSFYLGWTPTMLRDIPFSGIYWAGYDWFKTTLQKHYGKPGQDHQPFAISFVSGAFAGVVASFFTHPFDVIKTNCQIRIGGTAADMNKSIAVVIKEMYQARGIFVFTAGLIPRLVKVSPSCAIMISFYEYFKFLFQKHQ